MKNSKFLADWRNEPFSVKFWNSLVLVILIISPIFSLELFATEMFIGSILSLGIMMDGDSDQHYWIMFMPLFWILSIVALAGIGIEFSISRFNSWLDYKFKRKEDGDRN
jgi:hypothetical protein